jgi:DNA-binding GntR family transcriptional regulator
MLTDAIDSSRLDSPLGGQSLRAEVRERLRQAIMHGELKPGEQIVESRLARQLGISQAPVREALRELEQMGLVVNHTRRGTFVRELTPQDAWEMYTLRAQLESMAARLALPHLTDGDLSEMERLIEAMLRAGRSGNSEELTVADARFHEVLCERSGHKLLLRMWRSIHPLNWTQLTVAVLHRDLVELAERHRDIVDALRTRNADAVERAVQHHLLAVGEEVIRDLASGLAADA